MVECVPVQLHPEGQQMFFGALAGIVDQFEVGQQAFADEPFQFPPAVDVAVERRGGHPEPGRDGVHAEAVHAQFAAGPHDVGHRDERRPAADPRCDIVDCHVTLPESYTHKLRVALPNVNRSPWIKEQLLCYGEAMPRPRVYDPDVVLDAVETLVVTSGPAAATIRAISEAVGLSNGALYHSFGSRAALLGQTWVRAGRRFLALQREMVDAAGSGADGIVAAARAPAVFAEQHPASARLVLQIRREDTLSDDLPAPLAAELVDLEKQLVDLMIQLSITAWDRRDRAAVDTVTTCIVDLPTAILLQRNRLASTAAQDHLNAAVRAVLAVGPPPKGSS